MDKYDLDNGIKPLGNKIYEESDLIAFAKLKRKMERVLKVIIITSVTLLFIAQFLLMV